MKVPGQSDAVVRLTLDRLNAVADGIMAFAMTLLALNVDIPTNHDFSEQGLFAFFLSIEHDVLIYAASFFLIATYWVEHHAMFHYIRYVNRAFVWMNFLFLFAVTMLPFATKLKGLYEQEAPVVVIFGGVHLACWIGLLAIWRYAATHPALLRRPIDSNMFSAMNRRLLIGPAVILVAIAISFFSRRLGVLAFLSVPLFYLAPRPVDIHWSEAGDSAG